MFLLVANFYQFKGATTLRNIIFERIYFQIKNIFCQSFTIKYSNHNIERFKQVSNYNTCR